MFSNYCLSYTAPVTVTYKYILTALNITIAMPAWEHSHTLPTPAIAL